ncbi:hypothetical protein AAC387_Pa07g1617 [Persea americana]
MPNWVDLHKDLLERIHDFCTIPDQIQMQSVCKSWRSILKHAIPRELPWLMMLPNNSKSKQEEDEEEEEENPPPDVDARLFYSLPKQKFHTIPLPEMIGKRCCGSLQNGWLMIVDDKLDISLFHPWSKKKVDLPHRSTFKHDIFECGIYHIRSALSDDGNVLVFLYGFGHLAFCRMGNAAYTVIRSGIDESMDDVIYHKGQFYAVSQVGTVYLLHIEEGFPPCGEKLTSYLDSPICFSLYRYLVPDILTDSMFVITRKVNSVNQGFPVHKTIHFDIYRISLEQGSHDKKLKKFTKVESLGQRVVFLGYNYPMIVMASQFSGLKGNCIYFTDNIVDSFYYSPFGCCDLGVFNLEDGTVEELFADRFHPTLSPPLWIAAPPYSSQGDFGGESVMLGSTA